MQQKDHSYMRGVFVRKHEHIDSALRRFKKVCERSGIFDELRKREYFEKPSMINKKKKAAAVARERRRVTEDLQKLGQLPMPKKEKKEKRERKFSRE